jgi:PPOX class probable FMN-dependent enzyme
VTTTPDHAIRSVDELRSLVGEPGERALSKETTLLDDRAESFIASSPFLVLATSAADGTTDASPKGGPPGFVRVFDEQRLGIPEFPGNRRFDGVHNIVDRPGVGLLFVVPGIAETLRVNGRATLSRDPALTAQFEVDGKAPWFVVDVEVEQVFSHCSKAFLRSHLWKPEHWPDPADVRTPFRSVYQRAEAEGRTEADVRAEVEKSYEPELY